MTGYASGTAQDGIDGVAFSIVIILFVAVTLLGFGAARWRRAHALSTLDEWGLGGRGFGSFVTWFLLGGDLYTAYTFIAVPAAMFATGAVAGFFAVPYTIIVYPLIFVFMPRLWSVCHRHGYVTPADFVRGRFDSRSLSLAIALTGIVATMPYIALQLVGIQAVLEVIGIGGTTNAFLKDLPLIIAFLVLAAYTYSSGLRAPALIAFVKDGLIYLVIIVAIIYIPYKLHGFGRIFDAASGKLTGPDAAPGSSFLPTGPGMWSYATLALGSAMALFMYPHAVTGVLSTRNRSIVRRNAAVLPAYSLMLGLLALLGFMGIAAKTSVIGLNGQPNPQLVVPALFRQMFPSWFAGIAFAAVAIGALVPAAIMSIAAANLFTRNIYREFFDRGASEERQASVSKVVSLIVKIGALLFVFLLDRTSALNFQLLGGIWILQTFPAVVVGLYTRWFHRYALLLGWVAAMAYGTIKAYNVVNPVTGKHFGGSVATIPFLGGNTGYIALTAFVLNIVVVVVLTIIFRLLRVPDGRDSTTAADYHADAGDPRVRELPAVGQPA